MPTIESGWEKFNEKIWDEPSYIFCNGCGTKNRSDTNWIRTCEKKDRSKDNMLLGLLIDPNSYMRKNPELALRDYKCPVCAKKEGLVKIARKCSKCGLPGHTKKKCDKV